MTTFCCYDSCIFLKKNFFLSLLRFPSLALKQPLQWTNAALSGVMAIGRLRPSFMLAASKAQVFSPSNGSCHLHTAGHRETAPA